MKFKAKVEVRLKDYYRDPEGEFVRNFLKTLGFSIEKARVAKIYELILEALDESSAKKACEEMCKRLLANPVKDDWKIEVEELR